MKKMLVPILIVLAALLVHHIGVAAAGEGDPFAVEVVGFETLERGVYVLRVKGERPLRFGLAK